MSETRRPRIRGRTLALLSLLVVALLAAWTLLSPRNELALIGKQPFAMRAIPTAGIGSRPWVNLSLGGLKIVYPQPSNVPPDFAKLPGASGVLVSDSANLAFMEPGWTGRATWSVGGDLIAAGPTFLQRTADPGKLDLWVCPYVFGDRPRAVELRINRPEETPIRLNLPPTRTREPKIEGASVKIGPYTIRLKPKPWISPSFPLRFDVTVDGGEPGDAFLLTFSEALAGGANLRYEGGKPAQLAFHNWDAVWGVLVHIQRVRPENVPVSVSRTTTPEGFTNMIFAAGDTDLLRLTISPEGYVHNVERGNLSGYAVLRVEEFWPGAEFGTRSIFGRDRLDAAALAGFKDGDVVDAIGYRTLDDLTQKDFVMKLPDPKRIPGTRAFEPGW